MHAHLLRLSALTALLTAPSVIHATECFVPPSTAVFGLQPEKYPPVNEIASIGMENDPDLLRVYNDIDWTKVPSSPIKPVDLSTTSYDAGTDPDCWWTSTLCTQPKVAGLNPDVTICNKPGSWGLTFDDGPTCFSPELYGFLSEQKQKATFFMLGGQVLTYPVEAKGAFDEGHDVLSHTWSHHGLTTLTNLQVVAELYYSVKVIQEVTGVSVKYFRPPYGDIDNRVRAIATQLGLTAVMWNDDTDDWKVNNNPDARTEVDAKFQAILDKASEYNAKNAGPIVLEHDNDQGPIQIYKDWYAKIKKVYPKVMSVTECLGEGGYYEPVPSDDAGATGTATTPETPTSTTSTVTVTTDSPSTTPTPNPESKAEEQKSPARKNDVGSFAAVAAGFLGLVMFYNLW
ncbi:hypothetical protein HK097_001411 [Rhizophlyctis rosea]|uniref:NodB homology domain-containing protein n=1 Tax=Rhizophlyctis rosea TaxID=64517 RepID=A0AAD5S799_9FUNG|nr:hypothetical protein HK097_001411 [Rhizophlyctis rosea]